MDLFDRWKPDQGQGERQREQLKTRQGAEAMLTLQHVGRHRALHLR